MRLESRRLPPYLFTCDVTHSLSVESHLQAIVLHFILSEIKISLSQILSIKFPHKGKKKKKRNKNRKKCPLSQGSRGRRTRRPRTSKSGLRHMFSSVVIPGAQVVFAAIRPNIYLCFVVYEPNKHLRDIHPSVFRTFMM